MDEAARIMEEGIVHVLAQYPELAEESTLVAEVRARREVVVAMPTHSEETAPNTDDVVQQAAQQAREAIDVVVSGSLNTETQPAAEAHQVEPAAQPAATGSLNAKAEAEEPAASFDAAAAAAQSGLELVETKTGALIADAARIPPKTAPRPRRSDTPKPYAEAAPAAELVQVETDKN